MNYALKKLFDAAEHKLELIPQKMIALEKLSKYIKGTEKPKREILDKISLLVGYQDWEKFKEALHGESSQIRLGQDPLSLCYYLPRYLSARYVDNDSLYMSPTGR